MQKFNGGNFDEFYLWKCANIQFLKFSPLKFCAVKYGYSTTESSVHSLYKSTWHMYIEWNVSDANQSCPDYWGALNFKFTH